jgi:hypothetical protein
MTTSMGVSMSSKMTEIMNTQAQAQLGLCIPAVDRPHCYVVTRNGTVATGPYRRGSWLAMVPPAQALQYRELSQGMTERMVGVTCYPAVLPATPLGAM